MKYIYRLLTPSSKLITEQNAQIDIIMRSPMSKTTSNVWRAVLDLWNHYPNERKHNPLFIPYQDLKNLTKYDDRDNVTIRQALKDLVDLGYIEIDYVGRNRPPRIHIYSPVAILNNDYLDDGEADVEPSLDTQKMCNSDDSLIHKKCVTEIKQGGKKCVTEPTAYVISNKEIEKEIEIETPKPPKGDFACEDSTTYTPPIYEDLTPRINEALGKWMMVHKYGNAKAETREALEEAVHNRAVTILGEVDGDEDDMVAAIEASYQYKQIYIPNDIKVKHKPSRSERGQRPEPKANTHYDSSSMGDLENIEQRLKSSGFYEEL